MVQVIPKRPGFGTRFGAALGSALSESIPKEIDRSRLSSGLQQFEKDSSSLSPMQQLARLSSIPGITPQMIQSFAELSKLQSQRQGVRNRAGRGDNEPIPRGSEGQPSPKDIKFGGEKLNRRQPSIQEVSGQEQMDTTPEEKAIQERHVGKNETRDEAVPKIRWTPQQVDQRASEILDDNEWMSPQEARELALSDEQRYLESPKDYQEQDKYFRDQKKLLDEQFDKDLSTYLQKTPIKAGEVPAEIYQDVTGENIQRIRREMNRELRTNPNANINSVADKWARRALQFAKVKKDFDVLANNSWWDMLIPSKRQAAIDQLNTYSKLYEETGNSEELYNKLISKMNFSPQVAATYAYPLSKNINDYVKKQKGPPSKDVALGGEARDKDSRRIASEIEDKITSKDSILAIIKSLKDKYPYFNESVFANQIREDFYSGRLSLNPRQKQELLKLESDITPNWADIIFAPGR